MNGTPVSRRGLMRALGLGVATAAGVGTVDTGRAAADGWRRYRHDARNSGNASVHDAPTTALVEDWQFRTRALVSAPTVAGGTLYVGTGNGLVALDRADGTLQWQTDHGQVIGSAPVRDGTAYFGTEDGRVHAVDAATGEPRWDAAVRDRPWATPTVTEEYVYVGSTDHRLYAFDREDGRQRWWFETNNSVGSPPAVVDGTIYFGTHAARVYALDRHDGDVKWSTRTSSNVGAAVAVGDDTLYVGDYDGMVYGLSTTDGSERWKLDTGGTAYSAPAVTDTTVYVKGGGTLYAVDAADGSVRWQFETGDWGMDPVVTEEAVYVGGERLYALDRGDGTVLGSFETSHRALSPIVVDGTVYVPSQAGDNFPAYLHAVVGGAKAVITGPNSVTWDQEATFRGGQSTTVADSITGYEWEFTGPAGSTYTGAEATHTFWIPGTYTVTLRVTDTAGRTGTTTHSVDVIPDRRLAALSIGTGFAGVTAASTASLLWLRRGGDDGTADDESAAGEDDDGSSDTDSEGGTASDAEDGEALDEKLIETLETAESHFQTAIAAPASDRVVVPRERYRQAHEAYQTAIELFDEIEEPPSGSPSHRTSLSRPRRNSSRSSPG